jgi:hypothetical protein
MAGIRGKSGPLGNQNAFRHGLAGINQRRANVAPNLAEQSIREEILVGLLAAKGGETQISTEMCVAGGNHRKRRVVFLVTLTNGRSDVLSNGVRLGSTSFSTLQKFRNIFRNTTAQSVRGRSL